VTRDRCEPHAASPDSRTAEKAAVAYAPTLRTFLAKTHRGAAHLSGQESSLLSAWLSNLDHTGHQSRANIGIGGQYAGDLPMQPTITSSQLVRVGHLPGSSVGSLLSDMRTWLDHHGIQPCEFRTATIAVDDIAFDVEFRHAEQAALFREAFVR
jgi:hypothetical protein